MLELPLVICLQQNRADQADDGPLVGKDADDIGPALDLLLYPGPFRQLLHRASGISWSFQLCSRSARPADDGVPRGQPSLRARAWTPAQDGVWAGAEGCFLIRGVWIRKKRCGRQRSKTHSPQPRPRRDLSDRVERAADPMWTARLRLFADNPRPSTTFCAAQRPTSVPGRLWPCLGRGAWPAVPPRTLVRTSHGCDG